MATEKPVQVRHTRFASSDQAEVREFMDQAYDGRVQVRATPGGDWRMTLHQADAGYFTSTDMRLPADLTTTVGGDDDDFVINTLVEGGIAIERGKAAFRCQPDDVVLITYPGAHYKIRSHDIRVRGITLPRSLLAEVATTAGDHRRASLESIFEPVKGGARRWRETARFADGLLADSEAAAAPLVIGAAARLLAASMLAIFPAIAAVELTITDGRDAHPATVRRAVSFIEAHADRNITLADIAAAASVTTRAVQLAFRRHLDTTPMAYLRRVRLDCAHRQLMATDPSRATVTAVAYRWGFPSPGRFAAHYRAAYGVPPSHTLRAEGSQDRRTDD